MTPRSAKVQAVKETYERLRLAAARRQPVAAVYENQPRLLCPHVLGRKAGRLHVFCYQFGGNSNSGLAVGQKEWALGDASPWRNSVKSSCAPKHGTPSRAPRDKLASMK
jgi:hypothetical protein